MKRALISILVFVSIFNSSPAALTENKLPANLVEALKAPTKVILYSLEPWERPSVGDQTLYQFKVLGQTELNQAQAASAIAPFQSAISGWDGYIAACFDPRHALRVSANKHSYDLLLCYACHQIYIYADGKLIDSLGASGSPKILNELLNSAKITLSKTDSDEDRAAHWKQVEENRARWIDVMPKSIRPLWTNSMWQQTSFELKPFRAALTNEYPDISKRILALLTWYGSGAGPWSGFPAYEISAEELLLDFSTTDLIAAIETSKLTDKQLEGAARLFGGWEFSQRRPNDLQTLPLELKKTLLKNSLKSTNTDKLERAKSAFGQP